MTQDWPDTCRCIKQASSCAVQLPLLYKLCERRIRHCSAVRAMSGFFNGSDVGFKHEQLYSRQYDSTGSTASTSQVSCFTRLSHLCLQDCPVTVNGISRFLRLASISMTRLAWV